MMTSKASWVGFIAGLGAATVVFSSFGCSKGASSMATVDGEAITAEEFNSYLQTKPDVRVMTENGTAVLPVDGTIGFQALQDLIGHRMLLKIAKAEGVYPTGEDVQKEIEFQRKLRPNYLATLQGRGLTIEQIKRGLTLDLAKERLMTKGIKITDQDLEAYKKANPAEFIDPARAEMVWIYVKSADAKAKVDKDLGSGQSFATVAMRYSEAPDVRANSAKFRDPNGNAPALRALPPAIATLIRNTAEQKSTQWVNLRDGWAKFYIERKTQDKPIQLTDAMKEAYRRKLSMEKGAANRDLQKQILNALKEAKVDVQPKAYKDAWKQAMDKFVSQDRADVPGSDNTR